MIQHKIIENITGRVIVVRANDLMRYSLYSGNKPLQFKRTGGRAVAVCTGKIAVYRKPSANEIHKDYQAHNARGLWLGSTFKNMRPEFDRLVHNLSEYEGLI